jgi:hypothetical protein
MQPVNLWRETTLSCTISIVYGHLRTALSGLDRANLCNLWRTLYTPSNAPESLKSPND